MKILLLTLLISNISFADIVVNGETWTTKEDKSYQSHKMMGQPSGQREKDRYQFEHKDDDKKTKVTKQFMALTITSNNSRTPAMAQKDFCDSVKTMKHAEKNLRSYEDRGSDQAAENYDIVQSQIRNERDFQEMIQSQFKKVSAKNCK